MDELVTKALDPDLRAAYALDPNPVALQTALQVQMIRLLFSLPRGMTVGDILKGKEAMDAASRPNQPAQPQAGKKQGKNH